MHTKRHPCLLWLCTCTHTQMPLAWYKIPIIVAFMCTHGQDPHLFLIIVAFACVHVQDPHLFLIMCHLRVYMYKTRIYSWLCVCTCTGFASALDYRYPFTLSHPTSIPYCEDDYPWSENKNHPQVRMPHMPLLNFLNIIRDRDRDREHTRVFILHAHYICLSLRIRPPGCLPVLFMTSRRFNCMYMCSFSWSASPCITTYVLSPDAVQWTTQSSVDEARLIWSCCVYMYACIYACI